jgi:two-component system, OmpR family, response regulator
VTDTVLVVDDSTFIVEGLVALLKKTYHAIPSFGGEECLQILKTVMPSVIILDIMMEPMDGWETLARIKDNPRTRHIPVLMFSAKKITFEEAEAHRVRIDDFLTKPVSPKELMAAVARILERQNRKKRTLSYWTARGVPAETIEEYLALSSNLDIDTSLLAVMKKQLDHPSITEMRRGELAASVVVLEERIRRTESLIESFFHDTGISLPDDSDLRESPADTTGTFPCEPSRPSPDEEDGQVHTMGPAPGTCGNDAGEAVPEALSGPFMAPVTDSLALAPPLWPEENPAAGNPSNPKPDQEPFTGDPLSRDGNIPVQDHRSESPHDAPHQEEAGPRNPGEDLPQCQDPSREGPVDACDEMYPGNAADGNAGEDRRPAEVPTGTDGLFAPGPRMDRDTTGDVPPEPPGIPGDREVSPSQGQATDIHPEPGSDPDAVSPGEDLLPANTPDRDTRGREVKIPEVPSIQPDPGRSGTGIIAAILRLFTRGRR